MLYRLNVLALSWRQQFYDLLGLNEAFAAVVWLLVPGSLVLGLICVTSNGDVLAGTAFLGLVTVLTLTLYRLDWGFFIFIGMVLICDQFPPPELEPSFTTRIGYFYNLKTLSYLPSSGAGVVNPLELHLVFLLFFWLLIVAIRKSVRTTRVAVWGTALLFFGGLIWSFAYGLQRGGEFMPALWEVRALFYFGVIYFFVPQIIHTKQQIQTFFWVCIAAISFKAFQGLMQYISFGFSFRGISALTNHEDPVFIVTLLALLVGLTLYKSARHQRRALIWLLFPLLMGFYVGQRRAAYAAIGSTVAVFVMLLSKKDQKKFLKATLPIIAVIAVYLAVFWNSHSQLGAFAQMVKSGVILDRSQMSTEDYYSNLYREFEKYNLAVTARRFPVLGIGFGNKYDKPLASIDLGVSIVDYIPHNAILWLVVKMGAAGFFLFWLFLNTFMYHGAAVFSRLRDPYLKAICVVILVAVLNQVVVSYFDLQLTYYRNMVYLGALMGILSAIEALEKPSWQVSATPAETGS